MELKRISPRSAIFFGVAAVVFYFISGLTQWILASRIPAFQAAIGTINPFQILVIVPIVGGIIAYILTLILVWVYNIVAKRNPISWEVDR